MKRITWYLWFSSVFHRIVVLRILLSFFFVFALMHFPSSPGHNHHNHHHNPPFFNSLLIKSFFLYLVFYCGCTCVAVPSLLSTFLPCGGGCGGEKAK